MKLTVRQPFPTPDGGIVMGEIAPEQIFANNYAVLAIDGSTTNTGMAIMRQFDGAIMYTISAEREKSKETPVHFNVRLKKQVEEILRRNKFITEVYYEEPVLYNASAVANLFMLRTFVEELIIENEPEFDYIKHYEVSNMRWKKILLDPIKVPSGTEKQKEAVKQKLVSALPFLSVVTQDELDAIGLGYAACKEIQDDGSGDRLQSKKKAHAFKYNIQFIGAEEDDAMFVEFWDIYKGPKTLLDNGIGFKEIDKRKDFDKFVYETMGEEDKILIIKFSSKYHSNIVLQYKVGHLAASYPYLYAIVWRVSRK